MKVMAVVQLLRPVALPLLFLANLLAPLQNNVLERRPG